MKLQLMGEKLKHVAETTKENRCRQKKWQKTIREQSWKLKSAK